MHCAHIERASDAPGAANVQRKISAPVDDSVKIMTPDRRRARVEVVADTFGSENRDRMRTQVGIECVAHGIGVPLFRQIDVRYLGLCMHAGIRAPGALHQCFLSRQSLNSSRQHTLNGELIGLNLPTGKRRAVIVHREFVAWHDQTTSIPAFTGVPRRKSPALIGCLPARWTSMSRTAPSPHAIVSFPSNTVPGAPVPSPLVARNVLIRDP